MLEHLHAPHIDLVELDACVTRLSQCVRIISSAPPPGLSSVGVSGVADASLLDAVPGLPLLHHRRIMSGRIGRMDASATWTLGSSDDRERAIATTEVSCSPVLGRMVIIEDARLDLSNAPGPGDKDAVKRIARSLTRLQNLVKTQADALRISLATGDPAATVRRGIDAALLQAAPFASKAFDESPEDQDIEDVTLWTGAPYRRARITYRDEHHDMSEHHLLSTEAEEVLQRMVPPVVKMEISNFMGGIRYHFGHGSEGIGVQEIGDDPIQALRWHQTASDVPTPAWRSRGS